MPDLKFLSFVKTIVLFIHPGQPVSGGPNDTSVGLSKPEITPEMVEKIA
jgi:hypothetical protein